MIHPKWLRRPEVKDQAPTKGVVCWFSKAVVGPHWMPLILGRSDVSPKRSNMQLPPLWFPGEPPPLLHCPRSGWCSTMCIQWCAIETTCFILPVIMLSSTMTWKNFFFFFRKIKLILILKCVVLYFSVLYVCGWDRGASWMYGSPTHILTLTGVLNIPTWHYVSSNVFFFQCKNIKDLL